MCRRRIRAELGDVWVSTTYLAVAEGVEAMAQAGSFSSVLYHFRFSLIFYSRSIETLKCMKEVEKEDSTLVPNHQENENALYKPRHGHISFLNAS